MNIKTLDALKVSRHDSNIFLSFSKPKVRVSTSWHELITVSLSISWHESVGVGFVA
jgi:hypothetical protein